MYTDGVILLWKLNDSKETEQTSAFHEDDDVKLNKENWNVLKTLRWACHYYYVVKSWRCSSFPPTVQLDQSSYICVFSVVGVILKMFTTYPGLMMETLWCLALWTTLPSCGMWPRV